MLKIAIKISLLATIVSLTGCSLYMAPWEKPNPYHYEVLQEKPEIIYAPSQPQTSNLNFTPLVNSPLEGPSYKDEQSNVVKRQVYNAPPIQPQVQINNQPSYQEPVYSQPVYNNQPQRVYNSTDEMYQDESLSIPIQ